MGYCNDRQYRSFMKRVEDWEKNHIQDGIEITKFYFSLSKDQQKRRMHARKHSQLKYWKLSENDEKIVTKWDAFTFYKDRMFSETSFEEAPWIRINSNNKMIGRLTALRYLLITTDYENKTVLKPVKYSESISNYSATIEGVKFDNLTYEQFMTLTKYSDDF